MKMDKSIEEMTDQDWRDQLSPEQYRALRQKGTEYGFTGEYVDKFDDGTYHCAGCGADLFKSDDKYHSGCGWPSFDKPINDEALVETTDHSFGMTRVEITCAKCGGHIGHVFPDGPRDTTGMRYCTNSISLKFDEKQ